MSSSKRPFYEDDSLELDSRKKHKNEDTHIDPGKQGDVVVAEVVAGTTHPKPAHDELLAVDSKSVANHPSHPTPLSGMVRPLASVMSLQKEHHPGRRFVYPTHTTHPQAHPQFTPPATGTYPYDLSHHHTGLALAPNHTPFLGNTMGGPGGIGILNHSAPAPAGNDAASNVALPSANGPAMTKGMVDKNQDKRFACELCEKRYKTKGHLTEHHRMHTGERPFQCKKCDKAFRYSSELSVHKRLHNGRRPFQCTECNRRFVRSCYLKVHMRIHTGEKPFKCETCEKTFREARSLKKHIRTHTNEKPYACEWENCTRRFSHMSDRIRHMRTHTNDRPYKCDQCGRAFKQSTHLKKHKGGVRCAKAQKRRQEDLQRQQQQQPNGPIVHNSMAPAGLTQDSNAHGKKGVGIKPPAAGVPSIVDKQDKTKGGGVELISADSTGGGQGAPLHAHLMVPAHLSSLSGLPIEATQHQHPSLLVHTGHQQPDAQWHVIRDPPPPPPLHPMAHKQDDHQNM